MKPSTWQTCSTPSRMLAHLDGRASARKLRLFACACCRSLAHLLRDEESRAAVGAAERHADGLLAEEELTVARLRAEEAAARAWALWDDGTAQAQEAAAAAACPDPEAAATKASEYAAAAAQAEAGGDPAAWKAEQRRQSGLLRELFGDPWAPPVAPAPAWLAWGDGAVLALARSAYDGLPEELPVLADALEDAGCADERLLAHLRGPGPHPRGCWALGVILGLE